jgi:long-chain acyl-CoA synthetase
LAAFQLDRTIRPMNLANAFVASVDKHPQKPAIYWGESQIPYENLFRQSEFVRHQLVHDLGVQPGDRVAIWMKNAPEFVAILFGILRAGGVVVPINNFLTSSETQYILEDAGVKALFVDETLRASAEKIQSNLSPLKLLQADSLGTCEVSVERAVEEDHVSEEQDLAVIIYTSGTTGRPKGAMLSHGNLLHNVGSCEVTMKVTEHDRVALLLPMFHSFMMTVGILLPMTVGGSIVLIKSLNPPKNILKEIITHEATLMPAIPQLYRAFASADLPKLPLRLCISGAAPLPVEVLNRFNAKSNVPLIEGYGLSEASPVVTLNPVDGPWKAGSIGLPVHDVSVAIMDNDGNPLPAGETGELWVKGGNVMMGYWNRPDATGETLQDKWLKTGDMGYADEDGYLFITDRKKDMLLVNGINVYPREIEELIYRFEGVKEAAVVGLKDERKGEQPVAFVALDEEHVPDKSALINFLKSELASFKVPRHIHFMDALPRNATGKILKKDLRDSLSGV